MNVLKIVENIDINLNAFEEDENGIFEECDMEEFMYQVWDIKFDLIFCVHALQTLWASDVSKALEKMVKYLKPGGELHIHVPAMEQAARSILKNEVDNGAYFILWGMQEKPYHTGFTLLWLRSMVASTGAEIRKAAQGMFGLKHKDQEVKIVEHHLVATIRGD